MRRRQLLTLSVLAPFALVACDGRQSEVSGGQAAAPNFTYSPEGYEGVTIELDRPVERIAADFYSAAGLAQYGITPVAVFGFGQNESPGKAFDSEGVEVVGTDMELDIEALAVAEPDILVAYGNEKGDGWTWWDEKATSQVAELVDFVPVKLGLARTRGRHGLRRGPVRPLRPVVRRDLPRHRDDAARRRGRRGHDRVAPGRGPE